jgi:hypothetical protein
MKILLSHFFKFFFIIYIGGFSLFSKVRKREEKKERKKERRK